MTARRLLALCALLAFAAMASPARAGCHGDPEWCYWRAHRAIYHLGNHIAFLEADPMADDSDKGPLIEDAHAGRLRLRAMVGAHWPRWPTPCCYSRRPIYIH